MLVPTAIEMVFATNGLKSRGRRRATAAANGMPSPAPGAAPATMEAAVPPNASTVAGVMDTHGDGVR